MNPANRINDFNNVPDRQIVRISIECESAVEAALGVDEPRPCQPLHEFRKIGFRDAGDLRDHLCRARFSLLLGERDDSAERVFDRLRNHIRILGP